MSDTPRTDEKVLIAWECFAPTKYVSADFARQMEREIARLQMELDSTCNAEELRQTRAENAALRAALERNRELEKLARIGELAVAAQKSTDAYCGDQTIKPSEEDWRIDGTAEHKMFTKMEADIAALRAAIAAYLF